MTSDQDAHPQQLDTVGETPPSPPPPGARYPIRHRPRLPWLIAILVVLVLAAAVTTTLLIRANHDQTAKPPTASSSQPVTASASATSPATSGNASPSGSAGPVTPPLLGQGKEAPASAIPWSQVNGGWQLANWINKSSTNLPPQAPSTLYLVNPIGGRYRIANLPANSLVSQWSPDLHRAIVTIYGTPAVRREYDLSTGLPLTSFLGGDRALLSYAGPTGHSLLLKDPSVGAQPQRLELISTAGVHQRYLPGSTPQAGTFEVPALYLPGGSAFLIGGGRGFAVISNSGTVIRQIALPAGTRFCYLHQWWTTGTALASCAGPADSSPRNLYTIPVDGRAPAAITHAPPPQYGFGGGWHYSGGIVASVVTSCGPGGFELLDPSGNARTFHYQPPAGVSGQQGVTNVYADQVSVVTGNCGTASRSLFSVDLHTGNTSALLGPGLNGGSVTNVLTVRTW